MCFDGEHLIWFYKGEEGYIINFYDGENTRTIANSNYYIYDLQLDGGKGAWYAYNGQGYDIYFFDGQNKKLVTTSSEYIGLLQLVNGQLAWSKYGENGYEIYIYNGQDVRLVSGAGNGSYYFDMGDGKLTWSNGYGGNSEIFLYDGQETRQITSNQEADYASNIDGGQVAWVRDPGLQVVEGVPVRVSYGNEEIFLYDGINSRQITSGNYNGSNFIFRNGRIAWGGNDQIWLYDPLDDGNNSDDGVKLWEEKATTDVNKVWTVRFNRSVDSSTINEQNITVTTAGNQPVAVSVLPGDDGKSAVVTPVGSYSPGQSYYLNICGNIKSAFGKFLKQAVKMKFTITPAAGENMTVQSMAFGGNKRIPLKYVNLGDNHFLAVGYGGPEPPPGSGGQQYEVIIYTLDTSNILWKDLEMLSKIKHLPL